MEKKYKRKKNFIFLILFTIIISIILGWSLNELYYINYELDDIPSPYNHIKEENIHFYLDKVCINGFYRRVNFKNTNSMDPVLDTNMTGIEKVFITKEDIHIGDIIAYTLNESTIIVHRVTEINEDKDGWYVKVKGDNIKKNDPIKVRFENVIGIHIGVIY